MKNPQKLIIFYRAKEINTKDIDREIYTKNKNVFQLFFFHNINVNIEKSDIFKKVLLKEFESVNPEMYIDIKTNTLKMVKKITSVDFNRIDKIIEEDYKKYLKNIDYRIKCIIDTFILFNRLYKDKTIIYIIPDKLSEKIQIMLKKNNIKYESISEEKNQIIIDFDIIYWANYFSRVNHKSLENQIIKDKNIINIIKLNNYN